MSEKCMIHDCDKLFYKIAKYNGSDVGYCRKHHIQYHYTDPIIDKLKKYWIIPVIIIAIIGIITTFIT